MASSLHILIVEARFYEEIADNLLKGASAVLAGAKAKFNVVTVPGILELPLAAILGLNPDRKPVQRYDGFIALGCAIKGETDHYEYVCAESMRGVQQIARDLRMPSGNGILTCPTWELAQNRANPAEGDAGGRAARACLRLIEVKQRFGL
ncbi:MAG: 6,7-dimethyl-8-ribityllumazine synthase [Rhodospirillaceae bacterium]|nr:6,7-dimethyl-8-ribityllumazine synthase [Rhodospirillaceae bacterium]